MSNSSPDPLLAAARGLLALLIGLFAFVSLMLAIGFVAVLTVQRGEIRDDVAGAGLEPVVYWAVVAGVLGLLVLMVLAALATSELRRIVLTVNAGDPFIEENANRLRRMGWQVLSMQALMVPLEHASRLGAQATGVRSVEFGSPSTGLALVLTLFVLARVFRLGSEMRGDLEGTI